MQQLSVYGDSYSRKLDSGEYLWVCFHEGVRIVNKIATGVKEIPPVSHCLASTSYWDAGSSKALQRLAPEMLRQHVFTSSWPFPLTLSFVSSLFFHLASSFAATSCHLYSPQRLGPPPGIPTLCLLLFQTFGDFRTQSKRQISVLTHYVVQSCLHICLHYVTLFLSTSIFPAGSLLVPLSRVTAGKRDRRQKGHGSREQEQERKKRGECKLLSRLQRTAQRHECEY